MSGLGGRPCSAHQVVARPRLGRIEPYLAEGVATRTTRQMSITLPNEMADAVKSHVESGAYASESEVIRDGLRALFAREDAVESWLRTEVATAYDEIHADPSIAVNGDAIRTRLAEHHRDRLASSR